MISCTARKYFKNTLKMHLASHKVLPSPPTLQQTIGTYTFLLVDRYLYMQQTLYKSKYSLSNHSVYSFGHKTGQFSINWDTQTECTSTSSITFGPQIRKFCFLLWRIALVLHHLGKDVFLFSCRLFVFMCKGDIEQDRCLCVVYKLICLHYRLYSIGPIMY